MSFNLMAAVTICSGFGAVTVSTVSTSICHEVMRQDAKFSFSNESGLYQVAKLLEFQLQISPSNKYSGLITFRMDWFDLLAV